MTLYLVFNKKNKGRCRWFNSVFEAWAFWYQEVRGDNYEKPVKYCVDL